jgi:transcriptional regulator with XRE-family HTH domain
MPTIYPIDFKMKAVRALRNRGEKTIAEVAEKVGVTANTLAKWRDNPKLTPAEGSNGHADAPAAAGATNGHAAPPGGKAAFVRAAPDLTAPEIVERARHANGHGAGEDAIVDRAGALLEEATRLRAENAELRSLLKKLL